jgi:hypothetical protein
VKQLLSKAAKGLLPKQRQHQQRNRENGASLGGYVRSLAFRTYYYSLTLTEAGSQIYPANVNQGVHEARWVVGNVSASANDAETHVSVNGSGASLSRSEYVNVNGQRNWLTNRVQNANAGVSVMN